MMLDGFMMYLLSAAGDILNQEHTKVHQDMSQPLCHYFISSSHNTYLTHNQIGGTSSTEAYVRWVPRGARGHGGVAAGGAGTHPAAARWQGADDGLPLRGAGLLGRCRRGARHLPRPHTHLQNPLPRCHRVHPRLRLQGEAGAGSPGVGAGCRVLSAACPRPHPRPHSRPQRSPYPVILSLENHCGLEQQATMARHMKAILGDMLLTQPLDRQDPDNLPSPEVRPPRLPLRPRVPSPP